MVLLRHQPANLKDVLVEPHFQPPQCVKQHCGGDPGSEQFKTEQGCLLPTRLLIFGIGCQAISQATRVLRRP
jgi:hypothetical protein